MIAIRFMRLLRWHRLDGVFLDKPRQVLDVLNRGLGENPVTEVEDVAGASRGGLQNSFGARPELLPIRKQKRGVEITLDRALKVEAAPGVIHGQTPVDADYVRTGFLHGGQQRGCVGAKINYGDAGLFERVDKFGGSGLHIAAIVLDAETTNPTIEHLNNVGSSAHLFGRVSGGD